MTSDQPAVSCTGCGIDVDPLDVFPGPRCIDCYRPIGEALAARMTAQDLAAMWGATTHRPDRRTPR